MPASHVLLQRYEPTADDPFDAVKAAHLLNRAGFGGTPEEVEKVRRLGPDGAVEWLLSFPDARAEEQSQTDVPDLAAIEGFPKSFKELRSQFAGKNDAQRKELRQKFMKANQEALAATWGWWVQRMANGPYPLQEKLTLFWHGHFTTSAKDERSALLMWEQNELLRRNAARNFRQFVRAISRDPAMLDYLNNAQNRKGHPNENYARELMELFTLGIGNYSENDIKEAARAFTGWTHDGDQFAFNRNQHDPGVKAFFGKIGAFDGDDIIEIILAHPACSRFISGEIFRFFAYDDLEDGLSESLAALLRESRYDLRPLLRTILTSKAFYSAKSIGVQIKCPVQLVVGTIRMLGTPMPPPLQLRGPLNLMGQMPFAPPNVKGWPGGRSWINASTLFVRYNTAVRLVGTAKLPAAEQQTCEAAVDAWVQRLIQRPIATEQRQVLIESLDGRTPSEPAIRHMLGLLVSMPEYQLC